MNTTLRRVWRLGATGSATLATVWCAAWSGGLFGAIFEPADNARSSWAAASAMIAAIAVLTGYVAYLVGRPGRVTGRLALTCAAAWLAVAVAGSLDAPRNVVLPLVAAFEILALAAVLPAARHRDPEPGPPPDDRSRTPAHPTLANLVAFIGLFAGALVTNTTMVAGFLGVIWAAIHALSY